MEGSSASYNATKNGCRPSDRENDGERCPVAKDGAQTLNRLPDMYSVSTTTREEADVTEADSERKRRFDALFREHIAGIASYCRWRSYPASDGEDAVAEVFLIAWRRLDQVPRGREARPWLYAVARRVIANQARADVRRARLSEKLSSQPVAFESDEDPLVGLVHETLAALPAGDREVLLLAEWEGLTPAEIARVMNRPAVTVRGRLHRARRRFRIAFESSRVATKDPISGSVSPALSRCEP